jgi:hypothetical protein
MFIIKKMRKKIIPFMLLFYQFCYAGEVRYGFLTGGRGGYQDTGDVPFLKTFMKDGYILKGVFMGDFSFISSFLDFVLKIDTKEVSESTIEDLWDVRIKKAYLIDEIYMAIKPADWIFFYPGKKEVVIFDGIILQNYLTGFSFRIDLYEGKDIPFVISGGIYKAEKSEELLGTDSFDPIAFISLDYLFNLAEGLSLSFLFFNDRSNFFGTMMNNALQQILLPILEYRIKMETDFRKRYRMMEMYERIIEEPVKNSEGNLYWLSLSGKKYLWNFLLKGGFSFEFGNSDVRYIDIFTGYEKRVDIDFLGYAGFFKCFYKGSRRFEPFISFLYMSGNEGPFDFSDEYESFLGLYPYITETSIFYSGGINSHFSTGSLSPSGIMAYGSISFVLGMNIKYFLNLELLQAFLFSPVSPKKIGEIEVGRVYGYETDVIIKKDLYKFITLMAEGDLFFPGDFFTKSGVIFRIQGGIDISM